MEIKLHLWIVSYNVSIGKTTPAMTTINGKHVITTTDNVEEVRSVLVKNCNNDTITVQNIVRANYIGDVVY